MPKYMTPEDVEEEKMSKKAEKAYNKAMPEADTTFNMSERKDFDTDIKRAKESLAMKEGDNAVYSKERGLGPGMAARRLEKRGVDIPGLVGKRVRNEAVGMKKGGAVGSASKRADGIATKGKTKGRFI